MNTYSYKDYNISELLDRRQNKNSLCYIIVMLDDVGSGPFIFFVLLMLVVFPLILLSLSFLAAFLVKIVSKKVFRFSFSKNLFIGTIIVSFILLSAATKIPNMLEKFQMDNYVIPISDMSFDLSDINKTVTGDEVIINFTITPARTSEYQAIITLTPGYRLISINGIDKSGSNKLPRFNLVQGEPTNMNFVFSNPRDLPNYFSITLTPKSPVFDYEGFNSMIFTGDSDRSSAWSYGKGKRYKVIYIEEFNFNNY
jgi:hypothetical protein